MQIALPRFRSAECRCETRLLAADRRHWYIIHEVYPRQRKLKSVRCLKKRGLHGSRQRPCSFLLPVGPIRLPPRCTAVARQDASDSGRALLPCRSRCHAYQAMCMIGPRLQVLLDRREPLNVTCMPFASTYSLGRR